MYHLVLLVCLNCVYDDDNDEQIENKTVSMKHFDEAISVVIQGGISSQDSDVQQPDWIQKMKDTDKPVTPLFDFTKKQQKKTASSFS